MLDCVEFGGAGQVASAAWWDRDHGDGSAPPVPPEAALQDAVRDLFQAPALPAAFSRGFPRPGAHYVCRS